MMLLFPGYIVFITFAAILHHLASRSPFTQVVESDTRQHYQLNGQECDQRRDNGR